VLTVYTPKGADTGNTGNTLEIAYKLFYFNNIRVPQRGREHIGNPGNTCPNRCEGVPRGVPASAANTYVKRKKGLRWNFRGCSRCSPCPRCAHDVQQANKRRKLALRAHIHLGEVYRFREPGGGTSVCSGFPLAEQQKSPPRYTHGSESSRANLKPPGANAGHFKREGEQVCQT
jgi:hypothetical protein